MYSFNQLEAEMGVVRGRAFTERSGWCIAAASVRKRLAKEL